MPNYKGHLVGGTFVYAGFLYLLTLFCIPAVSFSLGLEWLLFTLAGALFPDIDVKSKGQKYFYWVIFALAIFLVLKNKLKLALAVTIFSVIPMLCKHRGIFHRTWFVVLLIVLIAALLILHFPHCQRIIAFDALFFMVGALSHLWLDLGWRGMLRR